MDHLSAGSTPTWVLQSHSLVCIKSCTNNIDSNSRTSKYLFYLPFTAHGFESTSNFYIRDIYFISQSKQKLIMIAAISRKTDISNFVSYSEPTIILQNNSSIASSVYFLSLAFFVWKVHQRLAFLIIGMMTPLFISDAILTEKCTACTWTQFSAGETPFSAAENWRELLQGHLYII